MRFRPSYPLPFLLKAIAAFYLWDAIRCGIALFRPEHEFHLFGISIHGTGFLLWHLFWLAISSYIAWGVWFAKIHAFTVAIVVYIYSLLICISGFVIPGTNNWFSKPHEGGLVLNVIVGLFVGVFWTLTAIGLLIKERSLLKEFDQGN